MAPTENNISESSAVPRTKLFASKSLSEYVAIGLPPGPMRTRPTVVSSHSMPAMTMWSYWSIRCAMSSPNTGVVIAMMPGGTLTAANTRPSSWNSRTW